MVFLSFFLIRKICAQRTNNFYSDNMIKDSVIQVVEPWLEERGFFLVDCKISTDNVISIEFESYKASVNIDDCSALSAFVESQFDREEEDFSLEVSSAGIGYPFKVKAQWLKLIGKDVEVRLKDGRKFVGVLQSVGDNDFCVNVLRKVKPEGAKRPVQMEVDETYTYEEVKSVAQHIDF